MVSTAARVGSINVLLAVQFGQATQGLNTFASSVERTGQRTQRAVGGIDRSVLGMNRSLASINARGFTGVAVGALRARDAIDQLRGLALAAGVAVGGLVPAAVAASMIRTTDAAHRMSNQLRTVTDSASELKGIQEELFQVAQRSRAAFDSTVTIYARTARATEHLGLTQQKLLRITETVQKAFAVGGASAAEATGAAIQLSQGIASNRFSGEEFRSVAENAPVLLRGMAESLGVNIGKLREMAHAGELTAEVVTKAILEASDRIEADFAKTTSTIEQAWVKIGNAALKYAMDSKQASAASSAIVTVLNGVSSNIDTVADSLLLLGGTILSIMAGRPLNAIRQNSAAMGAHLAMVKQATAATMQQAQAEAVANATRLASARAYYAMATQGAATEATRVKAARELHAANIANLASQKALALATTQHSAALNAATISGRAFAAAGRAASGAWALIGGPFGAALLGIGAAMYVLSSESAKASAEAERLAGAADNVQQILATLEGRAAESGDAIKRLAEGFRDLINVEGFARARAEFDALSASTRDMNSQLQEMRRQASVAAELSVADAVKFQRLTTEFQVGAITLEEYTDALQDFARVNPDQSKIIADMVDLAEETDRARSAVQELGRIVEELDGKSATVTIRMVPEGLTEGGLAKKGDRPGASPMDLAAEDALGARLMAARQGWEEFFPELFKEPKKSRGGGSRATADDQFDNLVQGVRDRIAALQEEQIALGLNYREQERRKIALELEQQALRKVREEARRKGEQDWQNAQLSPEQIAQINEVSAAYADQADTVRVLTENMEFQKGILKDVLSGVREALEDGQITWEEFGDIALRVLDKIINKIEDQLIDALFSANSAGRGGGGFLGGLFGGGGGLLGGILIPGILHKGGDASRPNSYRAVAASDVSALPRFHSGRSGVGHDEMMAVLEKTESVLTQDQVSRTTEALGAAAGRMKDSGPQELFIRGVFVDDNGVIKARVESMGRQAADAGAMRGADMAKRNMEAWSVQLARDGSF